MKSKKENRLLNLAGKLAKAEAARAKSGLAASMCRNFASAETSDEKVMQHGK